MTLTIVVKDETEVREITAFFLMPESGVYVATVIDDSSGTHDESFVIADVTHFSVS
jgi:hypothetical protein